MGDGERMTTTESLTNDYLCYLDRDNNLIAQVTGRNGVCFSLDYAVTEVLNRKMVVVSGGDVDKLRELVKEAMENGI